MIFTGSIGCNSDTGGGGGGGGIGCNSDGGGGGGGGGGREDSIGEDKFIFSFIISMTFCICDAAIGMELPPQI